MGIKTVRGMFFSPSGTTRKLVQAMIDECGEFSGAQRARDLLCEPLKADEYYAPDELAVVGMPVFSGRIPPLELSGLHRLHGKGTPALAVVTYGNRAWEDALRELSDTLTAAGFVVVGAAALVARHSIFRQVAATRPDDGDIQQVRAFVRRTLTRLETAGAQALTTVPGNVPYREVKPGAFSPGADERCTLCGACVRRCPTQALSVADNALHVDAARCVSCTHCISVCPTQAMDFRGPQFEGMAAMFMEKFGARKECEFFE